LKNQHKSVKICVICGFKKNVDGAFAKVQLDVRTPFDQPDRGRSTRRPRRMMRPGWHRRLTQASLAFTLSNLVSAGFSFALSLLMARLAGDVFLGQWTVALTWATLLAGLAEFGLNTWLTREIARAPAQANQALAQTVLAKCVLWFIGGSLLWVCAPGLAREVATQTALRWAIWLALWGLVFGSWAAVLRAYHWGWLYCGLMTAGWAAQVALSAWVLQARPDVAGLMQIAVGAQAGQTLALGLVWWIGLRRQGGSFVWRWSAFGQMMTQAWPLALLGVVAAFQTRLPFLALDYARGAAEVALLSAAWRFNELSKFAIGGVLTAMLPAFASASPTASKQLLHRFQPHLFIWAGWLGVCLALGAPFIITAIYGRGFQAAQWPLQILGFGTAPMLLSYTLEIYLLAHHHETDILKWELITIGAQLVLGWPLLGRFGAAGAALSYALSRGFLWWVFHHKIKQMPAAGEEASPPPFEVG
jgi:O-antigen/teichoic acid export membrane protein